MLLKTWGRTHATWAPFLLRLGLGFMILPHGCQKLLGWFGGGGFSATLDVFSEKLGIAWPFAVLAIAAEFLGGLGLLLGFMTRLSALAVGGYMAAAAFRVHWANGFFMNWQGTKHGEGIEFHLLAVAMALALLATGGGHLSVDHALFGSGHRRR